MKFVTLFVLIILVAGSLGTVIFLNMQPVQLILTPVINGTYYHIPTMPLGLLVVFSLAIGFLLGYIFNSIQKLI